ncbi:MAG TPA: hypothetical protein PKL15_10570, partial [Saprospiraceae bacterium]|nr:hypothetical protein [Saprospiraceae bacterium]
MLLKHYKGAAWQMQQGLAQKAQAKKRVCDNLPKCKNGKPTGKDKKKSAPHCAEQTHQNKTKN